ncbi:hypothetical protein [Botrimarina hoheduenensis]|uniref:Uncharacterized protein n=1 Tax=Botrimarina hoheduenensis TaxID=2528000 RepID=A0A5C5VYD5_9BACT|nr:hypothetical protein [Botrimarina hoheduenensis]TWT43167.1 hypothetical protein Pla111_21170 [Botrimarina hoheduenensis]
MISSLLSSLVGVGVFVALMVGISRANARRWHRLADVYRAPETLPPGAQTHWQTVFLVGGDIGWNSYRGILTVGVTPQGLLLKLMPLFSLLHPPLLIPYADLSLEPKRWYLIGKTHQMTVRRVSDVQLIVHDTLVDWIKTQASTLAVAAR